MSTTRDENSRASTYLTSGKPLFQARNTDRKYFTNARYSNDQRVLSPERSPASRIPRKTSPPKAVASLKDAYERVTQEEEEGVWGRNGIVEDEVREGSPSPAPRTRGVGAGGLRERDEQRMNRLRDSLAGTRGSPSAQGGAAATEQAVEDDITTGTNGSAREGSVSGSGTSIEDDNTDNELFKKIKQHARDQQRAATAVSSQHGLFARGGVGTRVSETAQTLARRSSASSLESEPGVRIPSTWGRKARSVSGWMGSIISPDSSGEVHAKPARVVSEGSVDWVRAAINAPLPSIEDGSVTQEPTPPHSRPSSAQPINFSPEKSQIWDADLDFTAHSVQVSTSPKLKVRNTKLNDVKTREIETLSKRAVATTRLEEIKERNSEERSVSPEVLRRSSKESMTSVQSSENGENVLLSRPSSHSEALRTITEKGASTKSVSTGFYGKGIDPAIVKDDTIDETPVVELVKASRDRKSLDDTKTAAKDEPLKNSPPTMSPPEIPYEKTILEEEGEAIPGTPITIFKGAAANEKRDVQQGHKRDDSWDNLRRLARIASASPSPATAKHADKPSVEDLKNPDGLTTGSKRFSATSTPPKSDVDPEERIAAEISLFELPPADSKSERNSIRVPSPERDWDMEETPRPRTDPLSLPTPIVTGAYIDTPAPRGRPGRISRPISSNLEADEALHDEVSRLALKDFVRGSDVKSIHSKKDGSSSRPTRPQAFGPLSSHPTGRLLKAKSRQRSRPKVINTANPASVEEDLRQIQREAQLEDSTLDDFDELLTAEEDNLDFNSTSIIERPTDPETNLQGQPLGDKERERRQEILAYERLNKTIKSGLLNIRDAKRGIERLEDQVSSSPATMPHIHAPDNCAICAAADPVYHLNVPVPRLWFRDSTKWTGIRFTWRGLILALFLAWFVTETVTCEYICHPTYSTSNDWMPGDPFWGWALPTLIDRCTAGILRFFIQNSWRLLLWIWSSWTGGGVGETWPFSGVRGGSGSAGEAFRVPQSVETWNEGSMFEDEAI